jgi:hypothetical protein
MKHRLLVKSILSRQFMIPDISSILYNLLLIYSLEDLDVG